MRITSLALTPDNVLSCRPLWGDGPLYDAADLDAAVATLATLLKQNRARGTLLTDEQQRPRYFGSTVFVDQATADALVANPQPRLGARLLTAPPGGSSGILDEAAIGRGNAGDGLHMVVVSQGWDLSGVGAAAWPPLMGALLNDFQEVHRGYRLARMIGEAFGDDGVEIVTKSRAYPNTREFSFGAPPGQAMRSVMFWLTHAEAAREWSPLLPMFTYTAPRIQFTRQEQELLREALASGATDPVLAQRLGITVPAAKARWKRLFERVAERMPELLPARSVRTSAARGAQMRHVVLQFVRKHPAELTPYQPIAGRRGEGHRMAVPPAGARRLASDRD
jgi:hypothetical protein